MTMTTTDTNTRSPRCACPAGECRHGSRWASDDASQARVALRSAPERPSGGYREATARDRALTAAASLATPRASIDTATVGRMLRTIGACTGDAVTAADRLALATGTRENGSPIVGRAATALVTRAGCAGCPVRDACARWAVAMGEPAGFYGGMGPRARAEYVAATAPAPMPEPEPEPAGDAPEPEPRSLADRLAAEAERLAHRDALARAAFALRHRAR